APAPVVAPEPPKPAPVVEKPAPVKQAAKPTAKPKESASYSSKPVPADQSASYSSKPAPPPPCPDCAEVIGIEPIAVEGEGSGLGAIAGGVLGAVIGNQIGGGSGRDVARIAGIAGGAYAGHQIEKSQRAGTAYDIVVRFTQDGSTTRIRENAQPVWHVGDKVRVENGKLVPR
ncbi:MAG TPA: glycine zipper 2TM domain-containing protein, partial [Rhodocyclaceae bacterium]|nr:glycine zipper 2TM domain-containing protein [Rhodocyclaceae bacterium]